MNERSERLFYGVEVAVDVKQALTRVQMAMQATGVIADNWSDPNLFHVTLLFLGQVGAQHRQALHTVGTEVAAAHKRFELAATHPGMFERNRILWMAIRDDEGMDRLRALNQSIHAQVAAAIPVALEDRPYRAHLTLARKLDRASFPQVRAWTREQALTEVDGPLSWPVDSFCLFASTREQGRLVYPVLERFPLA